MNKGELIELLANEKGTTKADAERTINFIFDSFKKTLCEGGSIQLVGFGSFIVKRRKARTGRNPKTNEPIQIPASNTVSFKVSKALKDALQGIGGGEEEGEATAVEATTEPESEQVSQPTPLPDAESEATEQQPQI